MAETKNKKLIGFKLEMYWQHLQSPASEFDELFSAETIGALNKVGFTNNYSDETGYEYFFEQECLFDSWIDCIHGKLKPKIEFAHNALRKTFRILDTRAADFDNLLHQATREGVDACCEYVAFNRASDTIYAKLFEYPTHSGYVRITPLWRATDD